MWPQSYLRQKVVRRGLIEYPDRIDRGPTIIYSEGEWKRRNRPSMIRGYMLFTLFFGLFLIPTVILIVVATFFDGAPLFSRQNALPWVIILVMWPLLLIILFLVWAGYSPIIPALYQNGIQTMGRRFVPYGEIDTLVIEEPHDFFTREQVIITVDGGKNPYRPKETNYIPLDVLGPDGFAMIQAMVEANRSGTDLPELHLYGPRQGWGGNG